MLKKLIRDKTFLTILFTIILIILMVLLTGCSVKITNENEERDNTIEECKEKGGKPYVENYNDNRLRPIVHCIFDYEKAGDDNE